MGANPSTSIKNKYVKMLMTFSITSMLLLVTFSILLIPTVYAGDDSVSIIMNTMDQQQNPTTDFDAGSNAFITVSFDPGDENLTMYNVTQLNFNESALGLANASIMMFQNWTTNTNYQISNVSGVITDINASGNQVGSKLAFVLNLSLLDNSCGLLYVNVSNVDIWENGSLFSTIDYTAANETINIHPKAPSSLNAQTINSSSVNISFSKPASADSIYVERNTVPNWSFSSGITIGNTTNPFLIDNMLSPETTYYYQAWTWNQTQGWYSIRNTSTSVITSQNGIFLNGTIVNFSNPSEKIVGAEVWLMKRDMNDGDGGDEPMGEDGEGDMGGFYEFTNVTDSNGYFEINLSAGGAGQYELQIEKTGFVSYFNWELEFQEDETKELGSLPLPMIFDTDNQATIKGYIENDSSFGDGSGCLENAEIMLLNTNFNYMMLSEGKGGDMDKETSTNATGYFEINASFPSNYSIIAFIDGYYAEVNGPYTVTTEGQTVWSNMTLDHAEPDDVNVVIEFTDLDDAMVTVNQTIRAEAPVLRYAVDIIPEIGNSNGMVSASEVSSYLEFLTYSGPGFGFEEDEEDGEPSEGEEQGGPEFLAIPLENILDESTFDSYVSGSHDGTIDNLANTTAGDNSSIFYNATFNISLDGKIANSLDHSFNITTEHNNTVNLTLNIIYNNFYNITATETSTNLSIQNTNSNLTVIPGENESSLYYAYVNITLALNQSSYSLPIIEVPTWNVTDWWQFNKTKNGQLVEQKYTLIGKPLRRWDRWEYYMGDDQNRYLCYKLAESNNSFSNENYVTINDLQWLSMRENNITLQNDLDFPLYGGKSWNAVTWWGDPALATIVSTNVDKLTFNGTHSCVQINYLNMSDGSHVIGQQWYSPSLKFFVNRTQNVSLTEDNTWNLTAYSHGPFIESVTVGNITDQSSGLIENLYANLSINLSNFYDGPKSYMLDGCLFKESFNGPPEDIMWVFDNSDTLRDMTQSSDLIYINLSYDGGIINASGVDGPYTGQLEFREDHWDGSGSEFWIDTVDYYSFEVNYSHNEFISPAVRLVSSEAFGNGTQGSYNYLSLNATLNSSEGGTYRMHAGLDKIINRSGGWQDWRWITGTGTDDFTLVANTERNITLNFPGQEIFNRGYDGPYYIHLEIEDANNNTFVYQNDWYIADSYSYDDFASPCVFFNKTWMNNYQSHDYINQSTYLTINTSISVSESSGVGDYELCGSVHIGNLSNENEWGEFIAGTCDNQISLSIGENLVPLNFDLGEVQDRLSQVPGDNHTLKVDLSLSERMGDWIGPQMDHINYYTQNYSMNDLPDPPISITAFNDEVTNGDLNVSIYINITSDEYANQTYELHGGVHHNHTSDGNWQFITGNWTEITLQSPGSYVEYFLFSGMEIAGCGEDGPYNLWLGLDKVPEYHMVANTEYNTGSHLSTDFSQPDVQFNESNTSVGKWGEEYFAVNISVLVNNPGEYHIGGGIHYIEYMDGWDNWMFLDGFGREYMLTDDTDLTINFSQSLIRNNLPTDYNGPLVISMGIENASNWQHIDHLDYETSQSYSTSDFSMSSVVINSTHVFINSNGDLQLNATYYATSEQTCNVHGGVHDDYWWFITGEWMGDQTLSVGEHNVTLNFSGSQIFNSMRNPTKIWFGIEKRSNYQLLDNKEISLSGYTYQDFSAATSGIRIIREQMSDGSVDYMNSTGSKTYLTVNISINVTSGGEGDYWLDGGLDYVSNDNYEFITGTGREISLTVGNQTIPLNFRASDIQSSGKSGSFKAWMGIRDMNNNWEDVDNYEYTTASYSADDAPAPPVSFLDVADGSSDIAYINTSTDDFFTVNITLNVSSGNDGFYDLHGGVHYQTSGGWWQHITGTGEWIELSEGQNNKTLNFNAGEIKNKLNDGYNDNLMVWVGINDVTDWEEISHNEYITKQFSKTDFPGAKVTITGNDESVWGDNFTVNLTINTSNALTADTYEIHGGLNYIETSGGWDEWRFITGFHDDIALTASNEITYSCNFSAGDVYTALQGLTNKRLTAWISIENMSSWTELANIEYESASTYSGSDFNPPSITLNCTGDFYNNAANVEYLQVNVSLNKTDGFDGGTTYEINSGIHYVDTSNGWDEWRFITGFYREITPSDNVTIPLNFSGTALYETGETGPFEVWVGISRQGQWDDIAHDEYRTVTDYSNENFSAPPIEINSSVITDYVNDNGDLQINVSVKRPSVDDQIGGGPEPEYEYILEGCIHWKQGHQWKWISWTESSFNDSDYLAEEYIISLNFSGQELKKAAEKGWTGQQLVAWLSIRNTSTWAEVSRVDEYETQNSYIPNDFSDAPVSINKSQYVNEVLVNTTGGGSPYDYLNITVPLNITDGTTGNYKIFAGLFDGLNNTFVLGKSKEIVLSTDSVVLNFSGEKINRNRCNITEFRAKIFDEDNKFECDQYTNSTSQTFVYTDFTEKAPEASIGSNYSNTTDGSDNLVIQINISITENNCRYKLYGDIFDNTSSTFITKAKNVSYFDNATGDVSVNLTFSKTDIDNSGISAPFKLAFLELSIWNAAEGIWEPLDTKINPYWTREGYHTGQEE